MSATSEDILGTVDAIYAAALDPGQWATLMPAIGRIVDCNAGALVATGPAGAGLELVEWFGYERADAERYASYYASRDLLAADAIRRPDPLYFDYLYPDQPALARSEIQNELFAPLDAHHLMAVFAERSADGLTALTLRRGEKRGPFEAGEAAVMTALLPHLKRGAQIRRQLGDAAAERDAFGEPLERLAIGVAILDAEGEVKRLNRCAHRFAAAGDGLALRQRRLVATERAANARLAALIAGARRPGGAGGVLRAERRSGRAAYELLVSPLAREHAAANAGWMVLVLISNPELRPAVAAATLQSLHGLTPREAALAARMVGGESVAEAADALGLAKETARFHLRHIFEKTGTQRQGELVARLSHSIAVSAERLLHLREAEGRVTD